MTPEAKRGAMHPPMPEDVRRGLHRPQVEKHPHTIRKIVATGLAAAGVIAYANFSDDVNKFVNGIFTGPFPTITEAATPTPTEAVSDGLVIPEGLAVEDKQVRESMRLMIREGNAFELDVTEVKNYLATGETTDLKTFEIAKDAEGKAAFVIVKGGNNGFDENDLISVKAAIEKLNSLDPNILKTIRDKYVLKFLSIDIDNKNTFENKKGWGATYLHNSSGNVVILNHEMIIGDEYEKNFRIISCLICESRALYTSSYSTGTYITNAIDRLDDKIGIDKALYLQNFSKDWYKDGLTSESEKIVLQNTINAAISYYSQINLS